MRPGFIGMRWWLGLAFAGVAALTAVAVVAMLSAHSEQAFRRYGKEFALGNSVAAAESLKANKTPEGVARHAMQNRPKHSTWQFSCSTAKAGTISGPRSFGLHWDEVTGGHDALRTALSGYRYIHGRRDGSSYTIGLPIHRGAGAALVAYSLRPELRQQLGIDSNRIPPVRPDRIRRRCRPRSTHRRLDRSAPGQNRPCGQRHRRWKLRCRGDLELPRRSREPRALDRADADAAPGSVPDIGGRPRSSRAPARPAKRRRTARRPGAEDRVRATIAPTNCSESATPSRRTGPPTRRQLPLSGASPSISSRSECRVIFAS